MKKIKSIFLITLTITVFLNQIKIPKVNAQTQPITPAKPLNLPTSRLNPQVLKQLLDKKDITGAIRHVELGWKQQYEEYVKGELPSNNLLDVNQMRQVLRNIHKETGKKTALIYAVPTPNQLELILVTPDTSPINKRISAAKRDTLNEVVKQYRTAVVNPDSKPKEYLPPAQQLYQWMIAPLEPQLKAQKINNLIFCLGTGLRSTPLAALHDGKRFLAQKYSLGIIPAFNLLDYQPANIKNTRILAMGASEFPDNSPLPAVPIELSVITNNPWQGKALLNQEFTLQNLRSQRAQFPFGIVHLATHAEFSPGAVEQSYIQFWDKQLGLDQLNMLQLRNPNVQLLVLSACRTALGNPQAELGFAGLAVQSGAKAAIASLWSIDDGGTLAFMSQFYRQLKKSPLKSEALKQTQTAMLQQQVSLKNNSIIRGTVTTRLPEAIASLDNRTLSHPYYWAGFTLIGNPW